MQDDFITSLTYEVKEEILERYFYERRLIELQIPSVYELARQVRKLERELMFCFQQLYGLLIEDHYIKQFMHIIGIKSAPFKKGGKSETPAYKIRPSLQVRSLTKKGKFRKLLLKEYDILYGSAGEYRPAYENLREECKAVNHNMEVFAKNYDPMVIINFLKSMDPELVMKKYFLGSNFTPEEIETTGKELAFKKIHFENFALTDPLELPHPKTVRKPLVALAHNIYTTHADQIRTLLKQT